MRSMNLFILYCLLQGTYVYTMEWVDKSQKSMKPQECAHKNYLEKYSPRKLCDNCEFQHCPNNFVACLFCRKPTKVTLDGSPNCLMCQELIKKLLIAKLSISNDWRQVYFIRKGAFALLSRKTPLSRNYIAAFKNDKERLSAFKETTTAGLYKGAVQLSSGNKLHVWSNDLMIDAEDKKLITWESAEEYMQFIGEKYAYAIFGPETGAITLDKVPSDATATYEEIIEQEDSMENNVS